MCLQYLLLSSDIEILAVLLISTLITLITKPKSFLSACDTKHSSSSGLFLDGYYLQTCLPACIYYPDSTNTSQPYHANLSECNELLMTYFTPCVPPNVYTVSPSCYNIVYPHLCPIVLPGLVLSSLMSCMSYALFHLQLLCITPCLHWNATSLSMNSHDSLSFSSVPLPFSYL